MRTRIALFFALVSAICLFSLPVSAAPAAQNSLPDFTLNAQTTISVTLALTTGQVIVIPLDVHFIAQNEDGETGISVIAEADQQAGLFIGVAPSTTTTATLQYAGQPTPTPSSSAEAAVSNGNATHRANRNSNRRSGPGTNFSIVGRVPSGGEVVVVGENEDGTWLQLDDDSWVAEFLLDPIPESERASAVEDEDESEEEVTPEPTETPEADSEEEADENAAPADLDAYVTEIVGLGEQVTGAVNMLRVLFGDPQPDNDAWNGQIQSQLDILTSVLDQYLALPAVPGGEELHDQVTTVASICEQAVDYLAIGLENPFSIDIAAATQSTQACAAEAAELGTYIQSLQ